jgi:membrane protein implicated in regulation of membrane protease activity
MDFISWLVVGVLFMLAEFGIGKFYLMAIGLACVYPSIVAYVSDSVSLQIGAFSLGILIHLQLVKSLRKHKPTESSENNPADIGQHVEVIEWLDECTARVSYRGEEWQADKVAAEMPDASHGIIKSVQGNRLIISTEQSAS